MSGFLLMLGSVAVVVGLATYPNRWIALLVVAGALCLLLRDLLNQAETEGSANPSREKESSDV